MTTRPRTLLVTGASQGIGLAISTQLLQQGHHVIGLSRQVESKPIKHPRFYPHNIDLAELDNLSPQLRSISRRYPHIDGLICCAGRGRFGALEEFSCRQIRALMDLNFTSHACLVREFIPALKTQCKAQRPGNIIFIGSEAALQGGSRGAIYSASKFALRGFAQALRDECSRSQISITIINPGMVRTAFFDSLSFRPGPEDDHAILATDIATTVNMILAMRPGTVIDEINLSPLKKVIEFGPDFKPKEQ